MRKVAIVGSEEKYWTPKQRTKVIQEIMEILKKEADKFALTHIPPFYPYQPSYQSDKYFKMVVTLVSGGCPKGGVDIWAEIVADVLGIEKDIKYPEINQWEDQYVYVNNNKNIQTNLIGYKSRNIQIAEACDVLYCIDPKGRKWSGGRWTLTYTEKLGKETHLVLVE